VSTVTQKQQLPPDEREPTPKAEASETSETEELSEEQLEKVGGGTRTDWYRDMVINGQCSEDDSGAAPTIGTVLKK
jgi:hypothetical protein